MTVPQSSFSRASPVMLPPWLSSRWTTSAIGIAFREGAEFLDLLDLPRPEIIIGNPLGFLEGELEFHRLAARTSRSR